MKRKHYFISSLICMGLIVLFFVCYSIKFKVNYEAHLDPANAWSFLSVNCPHKVFVIISLILLSILLIMLPIQANISKKYPYFSVIVPSLFFLLLATQVVLIFLPGIIYVGIILTTIISLIGTVLNTIFMCPIISHRIKKNVDFEEKL